MWLRSVELLKKKQHLLTLGVRVYGLGGINTHLVAGCPEHLAGFSAVISSESFCRERLHAQGCSGLLRHTGPASHGSHRGISFYNLVSRHGENGSTFFKGVI